MVENNGLIPIIDRHGGPCSIPGTTNKNVVGLERGPLSLVSTIEELLDRKVAAPVYKIENTAIGMSRWPRGTLYPQKMAIASPTSGDRSVSIVRLWTQTMEFDLFSNANHQFSFMQRQSTKNRHIKSYKVLIKLWETSNILLQHFRHLWSIQKSMAYWAPMQVKIFSPSELFSSPKILFE
jgi:hypothetical protein